MNGENSKLNALLETVNLAELIAQPTPYREEAHDISADFQEIASTTDFGEIIPNVLDKKQEIIQEVVPYDAEKNAKAMVYGLQAVEAIILNPIAIYKHRNTVGGKEVIQLMREANKKQAMGEELTENEDRLVEAFARYQKEIAIVTNELSWTENRVTDLIKMAVPYCEATQFKMGAG